MLSNLLNRFSFLALLFTVILLPIFFLPFTKIPIEISKGLLLVTGLLITIIFWTVSRFYDGKIYKETKKLTLSSKGIQYPAIIFRSINQGGDLKEGDGIDVSYKINVNEWRGEKTIELVVKGLNPALQKN